MLNFKVLKAIGDNYVYILRCSESRVVVIDPAEAGVVLNYLEDSGLYPEACLITHGHFDHTGGVPDLLKSYRFKVYGSLECGVNNVNVTDNQIIQIGWLSIKVLFTPGHTQGSVCYYVTDNSSGARYVFTGDTLFTGGCGRIMGSNAEIMFDSIQKIIELPSDTIVCGGHDYMVENYEFALSSSHSNSNIMQRMNFIKHYSGADDGLLTNLSQEMLTNVFLMAKSAEEFAKLRSDKNSFVCS